MKIVVIEDNPRLAEKVRQQLYQSHLVEIAHSGDAGLDLITNGAFDLVILDLQLPDIPGLEVCRLIRKISNDIPILVVTGVDTSASRVTLLENGADDYITKPFDAAELRARINALARRRKRSTHTAILTVGDLTINSTKRQVERAGTLINLRRKEFDILEYLVSHAGRIMSRQMIIDHAWSSTTTSWVGSVDVHIKQLRDKVDRPFAYPLIKTSYGIGYYIELPKPTSTPPPGSKL